MTEDQIRLVQQTFALVEPHAEQTAAEFYRQLFTLDPTLRPLFHGDLDAQGRMLMATLALAVSSLTRLERLLPAVRELGARHARYGVRDEHYATVGSALLASLHWILEAAFTPAVRAAWLAAYLVLAETMQAAARETAPQPRPAGPGLR